MSWSNYVLGATKNIALRVLMEQKQMLLGHIDGVTVLMKKCYKVKYVYFMTAVVIVSTVLF